MVLATMRPKFLRRRVVASELIEEDDGTHTLRVKYWDNYKGGTDEWRGVSVVAAVPVSAVGSKAVTQVPLTMTVVSIP